MAKNLFNGHFHHGGKQATIQILLLFWGDEKVNYVYSPQLDLTGYGYNEQEAKDSFNHQLDEFLSYTLNKNFIDWKGDLEQIDDVTIIGFGI